MIKLVGFDLFARGEHSNRNRQIKTRPFFFHIGGCEIDGRLAHRKFVAGIRERGGDTVLGFFHGGVGQADERDESFAVAAIHLHLDGVGVNAVHGGGAGAGKHGGMFYRRKNFRNWNLRGRANYIAGLRGNLANGRRAPRYCVWSARMGTGGKNTAAPLADTRSS